MREGRTLDGMPNGKTNGSGAGDGEDPTLAASEQLIDRFLDAAWMERGLSRNTLTAYRTDLVALARWLAGQGKEISRTRRADVLAFIADRVEGGARPRSTARQLSSFRRLFRWLVREGRISEDPTARISMPKVGRPLPKALSEGEVEALLEAPNTEDNLGFRLLRAPGGLSKSGIVDLQRITPHLIPAQGTALSGGQYEYLDALVRKAGVVHYYLEDVDIHGRTTRHGPAVADFHRPLRPGKTKQR